MGTFASNVVLLNIILRLLSLSSLEGLETERSIREGEYWREKALASPRASYRKIHYFEKSIKADPAVAVTHLDLAEVYFDLAISYGHHDLYDKSQKEVKKALEADPSFVRAHYRLGMLYFLQGNFRQSRIEMEEAHRLDPEYVPAINSLRMLREEMGKNDSGLLKAKRN
ncbi:MAG: tetratricopeptide repeat protein [Candidatus Auribacterota bacterium]|nr:tetratricopeptide repeat protein [Candidatus Auribacterota bacterium]